MSDVKNNYKFSIIISVYNVEKYIKESIESVINQSIGFIDNVELLLVDDGSTDNSKVICKDFESKYPNNIHYYYKSNGGASSARNLGIKYAKGEYLNFLDSDDLLHKDALKVVYDFFEQNKDTIDIVTLPIECFEKQQGLYHRYLKFGNKSRIVDLEITPQDYIFSAAASFYKKSLFKEYKFNTNLKLAEDLYFNTKLFLKNSKFGIISHTDAVYYYRKRYSNNSITNTNEYAEFWLVDVLDYVYKGLLRDSKKIRKNIPIFLQYIFIYNIVKRMDTPNFVTKTTLNKFYRLCENILSNVTDDVIMTYNFNDNYYLLIMLLMFKNKDYDIKKLVYIDSQNNICIKGKTIKNLQEYSIQISSIKIQDDELYINAYFSDVITDNFKLVCEHNLGNKINIELTESDNIFIQRRFFDFVIGKTYIATAKIPVTKSGEYTIKLITNNSEIPLQIKNIYGDDSILLNKTYNTTAGECELHINNHLIIINLNN